MPENAATDYLERIVTARTGDLVIESPLEVATRLSETLTVWGCWDNAWSVPTYHPSSSSS